MWSTSIDAPDIPSTASIIPGPSGSPDSFRMSSFPPLIFLNCFKVIIKFKLGVSGVFSVFLQHYMYQTWTCVLQIHSLLLRWKKANYCKIQVSSLRRFAFATLRWPHCVRPPTPLRQPGSATRLITVLAPLPAHSGAQITWPPQSFIAIFALGLRVNGFGRFCTLRHRYPPDGPPSLNVNLTLKSQEYSCLEANITLHVLTISFIYPNRPTNVWWKRDKLKKRINNQK